MKLRICRRRIIPTLQLGLIERVRLLGASNVVSLHPHVIDAYQQNIEKLHIALSEGTVDPEVVSAFRNVMGGQSVPDSAVRPTNRCRRGG
jgi:hypothetical protein